MWYRVLLRRCSRTLIYWACCDHLHLHYTSRPCSKDDLALWIVLTLPSSRGLMIFSDLDFTITAPRKAPGSHCPTTRVIAPSTTTCRTETTISRLEYYIIGPNYCWFPPPTSSLYCSSLSPFCSSVCVWVLSTSQLDSQQKKNNKLRPQKCWTIPFSSLIYIEYLMKYIRPL